MASFGKLRFVELWVVTAVAVGLLVGGLAAPVTAHRGGFGHEWNQHLLPHARDDFYTQRQSDNRYVRVSGQTYVTVHPLEWFPLVGDVGLGRGVDTSSVSDTNPPGEVTVAAAPDLPTVQNGRRLRLVRVELCYDATATGVTFSEFLLRVDRNTSGITATNPVGGAADSTERHDQTCRSYEVDHVLRGDDMASAAITLSMTNSATFWIGRMTFVLEQSNLRA